MNQLNALLKKNVKLTMRQKGTTLFQLITPLLCLGMIYFVKLTAKYLIEHTRYGQPIPPLIFNLPFVYNKLDNVSLPIRTTTCDEWYLYTFNDSANSDDSKNYFGINNGVKSTGMLTSQHNVFQSKCDAVDKMSPYFIDLSTFNETTINGYLYNQLEQLKGCDYESLTNTSNNTISGLPDGAITINELNESSFVYNIQINDNRIPFYHRSNGVSQFEMHINKTNEFIPRSNVLNGVLWIADLFNKAYINKLFGNKMLISGVQTMPNDSQFYEGYLQRVMNLASGIFYPLAVSLLMPLFMHSIVLEKENKLIEIMKINGLKLRYYWLSNLLLNYLLYMITMVIFICTGRFVLKFSLFIDTNIVIIISILLAWGICQVGLAFFYVAFINKARNATIIGYMLSIWIPIIAVSLNLIVYELPKKCPLYLFMYPTFALCRLFYYITMKCAYETCIGSFNDLNKEMIECFVIMFVMGIVFCVVGIYLNEVVPQEYGVRRGVLFCCKCYGKRRRNNLSKGGYLLHKDYTGDNDLIFDDLRFNLEQSGDIINNTNNDNIQSECNKEHRMKTNDKCNHPLVVENLSKVYSSAVSKGKRSLDNLTLCLENEIFGLLGLNGAGKTTFFSLLTGIFEPTSGDAWVSGYSILTDINKVQELIGYCPQFDILWDDLSIEEHLSFYSQLKNPQQKSFVHIIEQTITNIRLDKHKHLLVKELSGGMKRRLSLGIALVGNPSIIFLDEPTTGLDPQSKREIWDILLNNKEHKCMILTTHLMDEAEILSDRIGIIVNGKLKCLGSKLELKKDHGKGFKLSIHMIPYANIDMNNIKANEETFISMRKEYNEKCIKNVFPKAKLIGSYKNIMVFEICNEEFDAEICFNTIETSKKEMYISDWSITQVSLEDIFIKLTEKDSQNKK